MDRRAVLTTLRGDEERSAVRTTFPHRAADDRHMVLSLAFQPVILFSAVGVSGVVVIGRILLGWAME